VPYVFYQTGVHIQFYDNDFNCSTGMKESLKKSLLVYIWSLMVREITYLYSEEPNITIMFKFLFGQCCPTAF
jgi:hypothetical protein